MTRRLVQVLPIALLLAAAAAGCGAGDRAPEKTGTSRLPPPTSELACRPLSPDLGPGRPTHLFGAGDGGLGVLYGDARVVELWTGSLVREATLSFDRHGPTGVLDAAGAALLGDTLLVLADRPRGRLRLLTRDGRDAGRVELGFPPQTLTAAGGRLFASPFVLTRDVVSLLHRVELDGPEPTVRPVGVAPLPSGDRGWLALGNLVALAGADDGSLFLAHRLARARAFRLRPDGGEPRAVRLALAPAEAEKLGVRPPTPFGEETLERIAVPVVDAAVGPAGGEVAYLTPSGRDAADGTPAKLLVRLGSGGKVRSVAELPVDARQLHHLPALGRWAVADETTVWTCAAPGGGGAP